LEITDTLGAGATYATHELSVTPRGTGLDTYLNSYTAAAAGARRINDPEGGDPPLFVRDTPGPLTFTGTVETTDPSRPASDPSCTADVSATVQLRPALPLLVSLKRPRKGRDGRGALIYQPRPPFTLILKHRTGSDRRAITVVARTIRRFRLPKKTAKAASQTFAQRPSDAVDTGDSGGGGRCNQLVCAPKTTRGGFLKGPEVYVFPIETRTGGLRVRLVSPDGYPPPYRPGPQQRNRKTPYGADIQVLQGGRRIARLRVVANCNGYGQSAKCRFRKISTKR
jgi:hypothetical protein